MLPFESSRNVSASARGFSIRRDQYRRQALSTATHTGAVQVRTPDDSFDMVMKPALWDSLSPQHKAAMEVAAKLTTFESMLKWTAADLPSCPDRAKARSRA